MQQDGAAPHTAGASMAWLAAHFPGRLISLKSEVEWAPHSPDLSPLDFFPLGIPEGPSLQGQATDNGSSEGCHRERSRQRAP